MPERLPSGCHARYRDCVIVLFPSPIPNRAENWVGVRALQPFRPDREGLELERLIIGAARCLEKFENDAFSDWTAKDIPRMNYRRLV